ncbi:MAG TPA: MFS transporter [Gaiellaceae bacterium]|nr:MFS transporter [Gaiellaceae bacterium]
MTAAAAAESRTFAAFANYNFRRYFAGQAISQIGTWMQNVAQSWLVYSLTGSGAALGLTVALQSLPMLLLGPYGGVVADRVDKRRVVIALQGVMALLALILGVLTLTHVVQVWQVFVLAFVLGITRVFEIPARQAFLLEMVGREDLRNAVSLNSVIPNAARAIGPALAGILIATTGVGVCFMLNAASFVAIILVLLTLDVAALDPSPPTPRARGQLREGLRYVAGRPILVVPLLMTALAGCLAVQWPVILPIVAARTFDGGPQTYGFLMASLGLGAVGGALYAARSGKIGLKPLTIFACWLGLALLLAALAPSLALEFAALALVGAGSVTFLSSTNATLQLNADPLMRGRVIALWLVASDGLNPIGGPVVGAVAQHFGGRAGLLLGALAALAAAGIGLYALRRHVSGRRSGVALALPGRVD